MQHLAIALAVLVATSGCTEKPDETPAATPPTRPGVVTVPPGSPMLSQLRIEAVPDADAAVEEVRAPGKVEANPNRVSHVLLPIGGRIVRVLVGFGDAVQEGQPLLEVDSPEAARERAKLAKARAEVTKAQAALAKADADLARSRDLFAHNAVARKEVLDAENQQQQKTGSLAEARATLHEAESRLGILGLDGDTTKEGPVIVRAPITGKVLDIAVAPGEFRNESSPPLMTIADLGHVLVAAEVPESQIRFIQIGESMQIALTAFPDRHLDAKVERIADTVDPSTHTVTVWADLPNPQGDLRPQMFGEIRHVERTARLPSLPASAVLEDEKGPFVYRETKPGEFEQVHVKLGPRADDHFAVLSGLTAGDRVVADGGMLLQGG